jgi:copper chaperone CopZ
VKTETVKIQNLKCHGCANTITQQLNKIVGVDQVVVDKDLNQVQFAYSSEEQLIRVIKNLTKMGYPPEGADNGLSRQAKSYISCAIGRMN